MKTRILIWCLGLTCLLPLLAKAQVNYAVSGDNTSAYVTRSDNASGNIVIASAYNGYPVTRIESAAFYYRTTLKSVTIPDSVELIGSQAFYACSGLTNVAMGNGVTDIQSDAFAGCTSLKSLTLPSGGLNLGAYAFNHCTSLSSVTINAGYIGSQAFADCTGLRNVTLGDGVTAMGTYAFINCFSLTNFSVSASNPDFSDINGILFDKGQQNLFVFPGGRGGSYVIPDSVTSIWQAAFFHCTNLTSVTIPNSVFAIGPWAFENCSQLKSVSVPESVTRIWQAAFNQCSGLTNVTIGNGVTNIGYSGFASCSNLTRVTIGTGLITLGNWIFQNCTRLTNVTFLGNAPIFNQFDAPFQNVAAGAKVYYYYGTTNWLATLGGLPTVMLGAPAPDVGTGSVGVKPGGFGFTVTGVVNQIIVVEASTNLVNWQSIWNRTLSTSSTNFVDPQWVNHPRRFYRAR